MAPNEGHGVGDSERQPSGLVDSSFPRQKLEGPALAVTQLFIVTLRQMCPQNTPEEGYSLENPQRALHWRIPKDCLINPYWIRTQQRESGESRVHGP